MARYRARVYCTWWRPCTGCRTESRLYRARDAVAGWPRRFRVIGRTR